MRRLAFIAFAILAAAPAFAAAPRIDKIEAKLFYQNSATLSDNVAMGSGVNLWNTVIGEGDAQEPANDVLIIVTIAADPSSYDDTPLSIEVKGDDGKVVATRRLKGLLVGDTGKVSRAVYLEDSTCNALSVKASIGKSTMTLEVPFACGE